MIAGGGDTPGGAGTGVDSGVGDSGAGSGGWSGSAGDIGMGGTAGANVGGMAGAAGGSGVAGGGTTIDPCSRSNWTANASEWDKNSPPYRTLDGLLTTRWSTGYDLVGGEWFSVDLGAVAAHLTQVVLDATDDPADFPISYELELSVDGSNFNSVATGSGTAVTTIDFPDTSARYLRVTQFGTRQSWWSIDEVRATCQAN